VKPDVSPPVVAEAPKPDAPKVEPPQAREAGLGPQEVRPPLNPAEPEVLARVMGENMDVAVAETAKALFSLSPEDVEALESEPVVTIPKLLARGFVQSQRQMLLTMARIVPAMLERHLTLQTKVKANESAFYDRWKEIDSAKHGDLVAKTAVLYRQLNPQATMAQAIEDVGMMVLGLAKIVPAAAAAAPSVGNGMAKTPPFRPAVGGPAAVPQQVESQPWDVLDPSRSE
jgi:hypothetical protein